MSIVANRDASQKSEQNGKKCRSWWDGACSFWAVQEDFVCTGIWFGPQGRKDEVMVNWIALVKPLKLKMSKLYFEYMYAVIAPRPKPSLTKQMTYSMDILRQTVCTAVNPIMVYNFTSLFTFTTVVGFVLKLNDDFLPNLFHMVGGWQSMSMVWLIAVLFADFFWSGFKSSLSSLLCLS